MELKKKKILERLRDKYRLVILNDNTFEEKFSFRLSRLNLFTFFGAGAVVLIILTAVLIAFTPLKEFIPGYDELQYTRTKLLKLTFKADSMEMELSGKTAYLNSILQVMKGEIKPDSILNVPDSLKKKYEHLNFKPSREDSALRKEIESQDKYTLSVDDKNKAGAGSFFFFVPVKGLVSNSFNSSEQHFGVDVVAKENEAIKCTLDGTVIFSGWTTETGYTMQVQHSNNLVSMYKHCSTLLKKAGTYVKAGEPVAIIGNSGEQSSGPHLHFELWYNGTPIDPQDYMVF